MNYYIRFYCSDCFNEDMQGCYDGGYSDPLCDETGMKLLFPSLEEAIAVADAVDKASLDEYNIFDEKTEQVVDGSYQRRQKYFEELRNRSKG